MAFAYLYAKEHHFPLDFSIILDNLSRKTDNTGKITQYSIRDKFVLAALDKKDFPEPEHLNILLKQHWNQFHLYSLIYKKISKMQ